MRIFLHLLIVLFSLSCCQSDSSSNNSSDEWVFLPPANHIIIYQKESQSSFNGRALTIRDSKLLKSLPIGRYPIDSLKNIQFPEIPKHWISSGHLQSLNSLDLNQVIGPNTPDASHICIFPSIPPSRLNACFGCPEWQVREYIKLKLWSKRYLHQGDDRLNSSE